MIRREFLKLCLGGAQALLFTPFFELPAYAREAWGGETGLTPYEETPEGDTEPLPALSGPLRDHRLSGRGPTGEDWGKSQTS